jgi:hypothetical protein
MQRFAPSAGQAVYHDFITAPTTCVPAKRLHAAWVVDGRLRHDQLEDAVRRVVSAHDSLRTALERIDGTLHQVVREPAEIIDQVCEKVDWDGTAQGIRRLITDLDDWWTVPRPLAMKVVVGRTGSQRTLVLFAFNHACSDGVSVELVLDQIRRAYQAPSDPAPRRGDVPQFAEYYAGMLLDGLEAAYDDWVGLLDRVAPAVPPWMMARKLATDRVHVNMLNWSFTQASNAAVRQASRRYRCSQFEVLAAAVGIYFRRPDRQPAALAIVHSGRHRPRGLEVAGLLRSYVIDPAAVQTGALVGDAVAARRDALRRSLGHFSRLPFEEVCERTGRSSGWRAGTAGQWEVEVNGMFAPAPPGSMDGFTVHHADPGASEEASCENGGPILLLSFTIGATGVDGSLRYVNPPVDPELAARVALEVEEMALFVDAPAEEPADRAPGFDRLAG